MQKLMVATTARQIAIHLNDALVLCCELCKYEELMLIYFRIDEECGRGCYTVTIE
jgi:hypothetical protein